MKDKKRQRELRIIREKLDDFEDTSEVNPREYVDLVFAIVKSYGSNAVSIFAFGEILGIIGDSTEFDRMTKKLNVRNIALEEITQSRFVTEKAPDGVLLFNMPDKDYNEIINRDPEATVAINNAFIKYNAMMQVNINSGGQCIMKTDDPDGEFTMTYYDEPGDEQEEVTYTDGEIEVIGKHINLDEPYTTEQEINIKNATYTIIAQERKGRVQTTAIHGFSICNYERVFEEALKIQKGNHSGYKISVKDKPRAYTLYRN